MEPREFKGKLSVRGSGEGLLIGLSARRTVRGMWDLIRKKSADEP